MKTMGVGLCLWLFLTSIAGAALTYWDPQGTNGANPYPGDLSGAWEDAAWATTNIGQATPQAWVDGTAAEFGIRTGGGTPAFTVTMNSDHTVAGIFNGGTVSHACDVTISGTGAMVVPYGAQAGAQGFYAADSSDGTPAYLRLNVTLAGPATVTAEGTGQIFLHGTNTYTGGTELGHAGAVWNGTVNFSNSYAFSTGPIMIVKSGGSLVLEGTAPVILTNAVVCTNTPATNVLNLVGNPAGLTFSGPWDLGVTTKIGVGGASNAVTLSGAISGAGALVKFNPGTLVLSGTNTYTGNTTNAAGTLSLSADANLGTAPGSARAYAIVLSNSAALDATASFSLKANRGVTLFGNAFIGAASGQTLTCRGVISGASGLSITNAGTLVLTGTNTYLGPTTNTGGTLSVSADNNLGTPPSSPNPYALVMSKGATLKATGSFTLDANRGIALLNRAFVSVANGQTLTYGGVIAGAFGLTLNKPGTLVLAGPNTYTGSTTVNQGTLALAAGGSIGLSAVTVSSGATLSNATTNAVALGGDTTLSAGALAAFTAGGGASSAVGEISVAGDLALNTNTLSVNVTGAALVPGSYRLLDCAGTLSGTADPAPTLSGIPLSSGYTAVVTSTPGLGGHVDLLIKATPAFSGLSASISLTYGSSSLTLSGTLGSADLIYPAPGETITVSINGNAQGTTITDAAGGFSFTYDPSALPVGGSAYTIGYSYGGNASLNPAADASTFLTVNPASLTVSANDATRVYGEPNPAFSDSVLGVVNGDNIAATNSCSATLTSPPGHYPIVPSLVDPNHRLSNYTVTANNGSLTVACPAITVAPADSVLPSGMVGRAYSLVLTASGGASPYSFTVSAGSSPAGLSLSPAGSLGGTAGSAGTNLFTVTATDVNGCAGSQAYTLVVSNSDVPLALTKATYNGLVYAPNDLAPASSGAFTLSTTTQRRFSGSLHLAGTRYSLSGLFDTNGTAGLTIPAHSPGSLRVELQLDLTTGSDRIAGTVSNGIWTAELAGDRAVFDARHNVAAQAGQYTMVVPGNHGQPDEPFGDGYGTVSVSKAGSIRLAGTLADGTKLTQTATLSKSGQWPLYSALYARQGLLLGWLTFTNDPAAALDLEGGLNWLKPGGNARYYASGFAVEPMVLGSRWVAPASFTNLLGQMVVQTGGMLEPPSFMVAGRLQGTAVLSGGNLSQNLTNAFQFGPGNKVLDLSDNHLRLAFTLASGAFRGSVVDPDAGRSIPFGGVLLQRPNSGSGCFLGTNQSGQVLLGP